MMTGKLGAAVTAFLVCEPATAPKNSDRSRSAETFGRYRAEFTCAGLRFQPDADASSLYFASVCRTSADHKAAALARLCEHAIQARDYYNRPQYLRPYLVAGAELVGSPGPPIAENICSRIVVPRVHDEMAHNHVGCVLVATQEGCVR
jgi:dTDP-4-amino-4,6-dideoxygalactose transaminase